MIGGRFGGITNKGYRPDYQYNDYNPRREKKQDEDRPKKTESRRKEKPKKEEDSDDNEAEEYKKKVRNKAKKSTKEEPVKKQPKPAPNKQLLDVFDFDEGESAGMPSNLGGQTKNPLPSGNDFGTFAAAPSNTFEDFWSQPAAAPQVQQPAKTSYQQPDPFGCNTVIKS